MIRVIVSAFCGLSLFACGSHSGIGHPTDPDGGPAGPPSKISSKISLTVSTDGDGGGSVTSPSGLSCGSVCSADLDTGTLVSLTATADPGSVFLGWSGAGCSGTGTCEVTVGKDAIHVTAQFGKQLLPPVSVKLTVNASGGGKITTDPRGSDCTGSTCTYFSGTRVTLTAVPDPNRVFYGWSDAGCGGDSRCVIRLGREDVTVSALFGDRLFIDTSFEAVLVSDQPLNHDVQGYGGVIMIVESVDHTKSVMGATLTVNDVNVPIDADGRFHLNQVSGLNIRPDSTVHLVATKGSFTTTLDLVCPDATIISPLDLSAVTPSQLLQVSWDRTLDYKTKLEPQLLLADYSFARNDWKIVTVQSVSRSAKTDSIAIPSGHGQGYDGYVLQLSIFGDAVLNDNGQGYCGVFKRLHLH